MPITSPRKQNPLIWTAWSITTCRAVDAAWACSAKSKSIEHEFVMFLANSFEVYAFG